MEDRWKTTWQPAQAGLRLRTLVKLEGCEAATVKPTKTLLPDMGPANRYLRRVYPGLQAGGTMESQLSV
ncbi:hypothetical protein XFF6992_510007 [Xanthomonas citri pv. fuscans]|nr:hypothetical protein XFF6992_510007 [Xanthomonas citri pv. fuscans]SOO35090.1 hypothetical protein XFF6994_5030004 [Xanthomonas citri pv. fuscans]